MEKFKNFLTRALSGFVLAVILLGGVLYNSYTLLAVFLLVAIMSLNEFMTNMEMAHRSIYYKKYTLLLGLLLYLTMVAPEIPFFKSLLIIAALIRFFLEIYKKKETQITALATETLAIMYTVVPMAILAQLGDKWEILMVVLIVWANDIGAYLVGMLFGRTKLMESISPKKTMEGFIGGVVLAIIVGTNIGYHFLSMDLALIGVLSLAVAIAAVGGDLFESMIKRNIGVKDSGRIMPGHGGMLDRFDALLFAAPVYYALSKLLSHIL